MMQLNAKLSIGPVTDAAFRMCSLFSATSKRQEKMPDVP